MGSYIRKKPILIIQQLEHEPPALLQDVCIDQGWSCHSILAQSGKIPCQLDGFDGLIVMGGPQSATNTHLPHIAEQIALLRQAIDRDLPVLGICLGAQLLARAAASDILPSPVRELGWFPIYPTPESADDPLFRSLDSYINVFQWHGETFSLPADSALLATNPDVPNQAFRIGSSQYGLQFHIEVDEKIIRTWIDIGACERNHLGKDGLERLIKLSPEYLPAMHKFCRQLTTSWLDSLHPMIR